MPRFTGTSLEVDTIKFTGNLPNGRLLETLHKTVGTANGVAFFSGNGGWEDVYASGPDYLKVTTTNDYKPGDWLEAWCSFGWEWDGDGTGGVRLRTDGPNTLLGSEAFALGTNPDWITLVGYELNIGTGSAPVSVSLQSDYTGMGNQDFYGQASLLVKHYRPFPTGT